MSRHLHCCFVERDESARHSIKQLGARRFDDGNFAYFDFQTDLALLSSLFNNTANIDGIVAGLSAYLGRTIR